MFLAAVSPRQMFLLVIYWLGFRCRTAYQTAAGQTHHPHTHNLRRMASLHCPLPCITAIVVETLAVYQAGTTSFCRTATL